MTYIHAPVYVNIPSDNGVGVHFDGIIPVVAVPSGPQGLPGQDGFSPVVTVTAITGGHQVSIEDATGTETFDVMDGEKGETGATGATGPAGADGVGVPSGGTTGQVLKKRSAVNYDTEWSDENDAVDSVNGQTGAVVLNASDVGALPDTYTAPVSSVNGQTGAVTVLFPTAVGTNGSDLGSVTTFTPTRDCWCLIHFYTASAQSMMPICRLNQNGTIVQQALGLVNAQTTSFLGAPVRGGMEYTISAYRCSVTHVQLFY